MKDNDPTSVLLFLVGTKKDLSVSDHFYYFYLTLFLQTWPCIIQYNLLPYTLHIYICPTNVSFLQSPAQYTLIEQDTIKLADQMKAEYWAVSALSGEFLTTEIAIVYYMLM